MIKILDPFTANQIAAGEVVERPVSVVKELLENAVDAGAGRVTISLSEGGLKRIEVADNGSGMTGEDLIIAPRRHATSKIDKAEDLNNLRTLGFRGEALPSIASVSRMTIISRIPGSTVGYRTVVDGGEPSLPDEVGCPVGTHVSVADLFFNTPARKKFLKSPSSELGLITDLVGRIAMSRPEVAFELEEEGRVLLKTPGTGDLAGALFAVWGGEIVRGMTEIKGSGEVSLMGYVSRPELTRSSRHYYNFFINGRLVRSIELNRLLEEAYYTRIPAKRYPLAVVHFTLPPESFDVNVHPAKMEVKFRDPDLLQRVFSQTLQDVFSQPRQVIPGIWHYPVTKKTAADPGASRTADPAAEEESGILSREHQGEAASLSQETLPFPEIDDHDEWDTPPVGPAERSALFSRYRVIGQLDGSYILAEGPDGLYIIDQHAAHERIRYERIRKLFAEQKRAFEYLAVPVTVELAGQQAIWLVDHILELSDLGFILEHFGGSTFLLRGVPRWNADGNSEELLLEIVEKLGNGGGCFDISRWADGEIATMACKGSVKANRHLTDGDIAYLMAQLEKTGNPYSCPHGRPVLMKLTREEIRKRFLRT